MKRNRSAFTLVELLIVVTIIGVIAAALLPRFNDGTGKSRDAVRKSDINNIAQAISLYASDHAGLYPTRLSCIQDQWASGNGLRYIYWQIDDYMTEVPADPAGHYWTGFSTCRTRGGYLYIPLRTSSSGTYSGYAMLAALENGNDKGENVYLGSSIDRTNANNRAQFLNDLQLCSDDGVDCSADQAVFMVIR